MVIDVVEILVHWHAGRRIGELCSSLRVDPKTVHKYTAPARAAGLAPGGPPLTNAQWAALVEEWFPGLTDRSSQHRTWPELEVHKERITGWIGAVTVATMHQRLRDDFGVAASESSLRRYISATFDEDVARQAVRVLRDTPPPGEEAQVDYGLLGRWSDPVTGRVRRVWGFLMVLACSRLLFLRPVLTMDERSWVEANVAALEFFGGVPRRIVPDNLKTGVVKPDLYDPKVNRAFGEFAEHYGTLIDPARILQPRDKARVERPVPYARDSFFAGREGEFESLVSMQADALRWCRDVANRRQCRPLERVAPQAVFDETERDSLGELPRERFELASWSRRKVHPDIHVKVGKALYSVPWRHIGTEVDVREGSRTVEIFAEGTLIKTHVRAERGKVTDETDYPPEKIAFFQRNPTWCRKKAAELGESVSQVVGTLFEVNALYRLRQVQGILALADKHTPERLEAACRRALAAGDPAYRTIKGILDAGTEDGEDAAPDVAPTAPAHLHGPERLFGAEEVAQ